MVIFSYLDREAFIKLINEFLSWIKLVSIGCHYLFNFSAVFIKILDILALRSTFYMFDSSEYSFVSRFDNLTFVCKRVPWGMSVNI